MSCNGCRVLRKGCSDTCVLRHSLRCIDSPDAQAHATLFVTKFFGRAGLTGFINGVPENQRPALFQSLLYEACGRTVNPVYGAVGLLFSGKWAVCQAAVETVLRGGSPKPSGVTDLQSTAPVPYSSAIDCSAGSISTIEQPHSAGTGIIKPNVPSGFCMQPQPFPSTDQSFLTSACSLKTKSTNCHGNPNYLLDFSTYSGSPSAAHDTTTVLPHLSKRIHHWKPESVKEDKDSLFKRPRPASFCPCAAPAVGNNHDVAQMSESTQRPSITSCVAAYKNSYARGPSQDGCEAQRDVEHVKQPGGEVVHRVVLRGLPGGYTPHGRVVAPVARRVHMPPHLKLLIEEYKDGRMSVDPSRVSSEECDYQPDMEMLGKRDLEPLPLQSMGSLDGVDGNIESEHGMPKLDLTLKAQPSKLGYAEPSLQQERDLINVDDRHHRHEEPHEFLRVSSPSVNSEGSVSTAVGGGSLKLMRPTICFNSGMESPKDGVKLLNLLL